MRRYLLSVVLSLGLAAAVAGCGSSSTTSSKGSGTGGSGGYSYAVNVGTGTPIEVHTKKPRIAFFGAGTSSYYLQAYNNGVMEEAKALGLSVTTYDPLFNPEKQEQQLENGLTQNEYQAWIVLPLDGEAECPLLTKQAPAKGIVVLSSLTVLCGRGLNPEGETLWAPGTVAQLQDDSTYTEDEAWLAEVAKRLPGNHVVAMLNAPPLLTVAQAFKKAMEWGGKQYPNLDFKYNIATEQSTSDCFTKAQNLLQAHPEVDVILSSYSDCTTGAIKAIDALGLKGKIKLFDVGGEKSSFEYIKKGELVLTTYHTPHKSGVEAVKAIAKAFQEPIPRYTGVYGPGATIGHPLIIDSSNVNKYTPEY